MQYIETFLRSIYCMLCKGVHDLHRRVIGRQNAQLLTHIRVES